MIDAQMVKDVCTKYIYDKCPAVAGIGTVHFFRVRLNLFTGDWRISTTFFSKLSFVL